MKEEEGKGLAAVEELLSPWGGRKKRFRVGGTHRKRLSNKPHPPGRIMEHLILVRSSLRVSGDFTSGACEAL